MTLLITGASGKLGNQLKKLFPDALTPPHCELDITNVESVFSYFRKNSIDSVIHCAAMTSVEACERDHRTAYETNVIGTKNVVGILDSFFKTGDFIYFVYVSTACVFSGDDNPNHRYSERIIPYPSNFYGLTKLLGEYVVNCLPSTFSTLIVRTNFVERGKWMYPKAFTDRFGTYLYADQVAKRIKELMEEELTGTVHICGSTRLSMFELARLGDPDVQPMTLKDYKGQAKLTKNMCLCSIRETNQDFKESPRQ